MECTMKDPKNMRPRAAALAYLHAADAHLHDANVANYRQHKPSIRASRAILEAQQIISDAIAFVEQN